MKYRLILATGTGDLSAPPCGSNPRNQVPVAFSLPDGQTMLGGL